MADDQATRKMGGTPAYGQDPAYGTGGLAHSGQQGTQATVILRPTGPVVLAWLVPVDGPSAGHIFRLDPRGTVIGRDGQNSQIVIEDESVSAMHAKVRAVETESGLEFFVQDMASANGTFVDGEEVVRQSLSDGTRITVGKTTMVFKQI